jgi:UTP--glucose-1-phosphate uridylyltransferase
MAGSVLKITLRFSSTTHTGGTMTHSKPSAPDNKAVSKAVFPVAGLGTRFLPATKSTPKEMLPVVDKPLIQYAAEEAVQAHVESLIFITSRMKHTISDHFDVAFELETRLERGGKEELLKRCRQTLPKEVSRLYIPQGEALGLGHAVLCAEPAVGDEFFTVLLADDLILDRAGQGCLHQLIEAHRLTGASIIAVEPISDEDCERYGVVSVSESADQELPMNLMRLNGIVEKPATTDAPSRLGVVGRYLLSPKIFHYLARQPADHRGEIQLTDAIAQLLKHEPVYALAFRGQRYDCGSKAGFVQATLDVAMEDESLRHELSQRLHQHLQSNSNAA